MLPEKWYLIITEENLDFCKSLEKNELGFEKGYSYVIDGAYSAIENCPGYATIYKYKDWEEISSSDFEKYVLNKSIVKENNKNLVLLLDELQIK
tara:strand:+ start:192 stop:473 length:282 start_codon:yes stop_codon:yes gene_type:complete